MFNVIDIEMLDVYTEGFEFTYASPNTITISAGKYVNGSGYQYDDVVTETSRVVKEYVFEGISFDVMNDPDFDVIYDVYLILYDDGTNDFEVIRTVIGGEHIASYEGPGQILHTLGTCIVSPTISDYSELDFKVRSIKEKVYEKNQT